MQISKQDDKRLLGAGLKLTKCSSFLPHRQETTGQMQFRVYNEGYPRLVLIQDDSYLVEIRSYQRQSR